MRLVLWLLGLIGLGVLMGFVARLVLPRHDEPVVYSAPFSDGVSEASRSA